MKREVSVLLADALESGEYKQTTGYLKRHDCMCVMGVLCDLYAKEHKIEKPWKPFGVMKEKSGFLDADTLRGPPQEVIQWAGLMDRKGGMSPEGDTLIKLNDTGMGFLLLAQTIRFNNPMKVP